MLPMVFNGYQGVPFIQQRRTVEGATSVLAHGFEGAGVHGFKEDACSETTYAFGVACRVTGDGHVHLSSVVVRPRYSVPILIFEFAVLVELFSPTTPFMGLAAPIMDP